MRLLHVRSAALAAIAALIASPAAAQQQPGPGVTNRLIGDLVDAAAPFPTVSSLTGACLLAADHAVQLLGASGTGTAGGYVYILNLAAVPSTPYPVQDGDLLGTTPLPIPASGNWTFPLNGPVTASRGAVICVSSTLWISHVLTLTPVTSSAATDNAVAALVR